MDHSGQHTAQAYGRPPFLEDLNSFDTNQAGSSSSAHNSTTPAFFGASSPSYPDFNTPAPNAANQEVPQNSTNNPPPTPFTPSYAAQAGSYNNSPLNSDISYIPGNEFANPDFDQQQPSSFDPSQFDFSVINVLPPDDGYDPSAYDPPTDHNSFLFSDFMPSLADTEQAGQQNMSQANASPSLSTSSLGSNTAAHNQPHVSVTPAHDSFDAQNALRMGMGSNYVPYDQGSPASSNGDNGANSVANVTRSRASSVSSVNNHLLRGSPQPDTNQTFGMENVTFENAPSPGHNSSWTGGRPPQSPSLNGPQSPPQLFIPGGPPEITHTANSPSPTHSAHSNHADLARTANSLNHPPGGLMAPNGPGIEIVPATPISTGAGTAAAQRPIFQQVLATISQGQPTPQDILTQGQSNPSPLWPQPQLSHSPQPSFQTMHHQPESHVRSHASSASPQPRPQLPQAPPSPYNFSSNTLTPPPTTSATALAEGGDFDAPRQSQGQYSPQASPNLGALQLGQSSGGEYLVPIGQNHRSRSKSDTSLRPPMWQIGLNIGQHGVGQSMGGVSIPEGPQLPMLNAPQMGGSPGSSPMISQPQLGQHFSYGPPATGHDNGSMPNTAQSSGLLSPNTGLGFNTNGGISGIDMRRVRSESTGHKRNALSADMTPRFLEPGDALQFGSHPGSGASSPFLSANDDLPSVPGNIGAHRRTFSGGSHGHHRSLSRERVAFGASPYPSPHASPRVNTGDLPDISDQGGNYRQGRGPVRGGTPSESIAVHVMGVDANGNPMVQSQAPLIVARQNVTTHATADASQRRRRTEANFVCPVPGCGSTFTRHFNLKGHLRSHNEERPFKCKWPGCDKGFARQHDCKRHEQLHLNIRPYTCNGCKRTFARMDALNRHLRSDAGTECQASQPILTNDQPNNPALAAAIANDDFMNLKKEPEAGWQPTSTGVMV